MIAAEHAKIRLSHMIQALQKKLAPWFRAAKEPVVQIAASVGVLLSGVVGSVGLLITGLVGVVDRLLDVVGLGGMRRRLIRGLGFDRMLGGLGVDKVSPGWVWGISSAKRRRHRTRTRRPRVAAEREDSPSSVTSVWGMARLGRQPESGGPVASRVVDYRSLVSSVWGRPLPRQQRRRMMTS